LADRHRSTDVISFQRFLWKIPMPATRLAPERTAHARTRQPPTFPARDIDWERLDAVVLYTLEDPGLHRSLCRLDKLELADVRSLAERVLWRHKIASPEVIAPRALHERLVQGLSGE
jgi:hypothetical protein